MIMLDDWLATVAMLECKLAACPGDSFVEGRLAVARSVVRRLIYGLEVTDGLHGLAGRVA